MTFHITDPFIFTLFGASGDLATLKLFPALFELARRGRLPKTYYIVGFARTKKNRQAFQKDFAQSIREAFGLHTDEAMLTDILSHVYYFTGQYQDASAFRQFRGYIKRVTKGNAPRLHLAYFSAPSVVFHDIILHLGNTKEPDEDLRLIIEKPFGKSRTSAEELFHFAAQYFPVEQVYLLDHYLGKGAVRSILELRHANRLLNLAMRGAEIANIQITALESIGIADRVGYFDQAGTIKDMVQSHLLQTLAIVTMSTPITRSPWSIHRERQSILSAVLPPEHPDDIVLGQYDGYKKEKGVPTASRTETFVGLRLFIDRAAWYQVPIYLRTGKKTAEKHTFVVIELKKFSFQNPKEEPNRVVIDIQPEERLSIKLLNRVGEHAEYQEISTSDSLACDPALCLPDHAALILDAIRGDKTYFLSFPEIIETWRVTDAVLDLVSQHKISPDIYADGSRGPASQDRLTKKDGFRWYDVDEIVERRK